MILFDYFFFLGKTVTLTCDVNKDHQKRDWLHWYKQTAGDTLKLILMHKMNTNPVYGPGFPSSAFNATSDDKTFNLTILETAREDEGMYHCAYSNWFESTWNGMYLLIEGNDRTSSYRVVQQPAVLDPSRPADSDTLQCSLLSQPEEKTCSGEPRVFWLRSVPDLIYTDGKTQCEKPSNTEKRCSYNFSRMVSPSDVGTYYCAVATCGEILLGNGTTVKIGRFSFNVIVLAVTVICLVISVVVNILLICCRAQRTSHKKREDGEHMTYAALHFSTGTVNRRELKTEESVYSNVRFSQFEYTS
uniref:Ig-like domain-containing protein n=1 Tax=Cyprinodon variegatus TaxID=28743 RepID=A0A3Q2EC47_CYPVA